MKLLLEKGADVKSKNGFDQTPLWWAVEEGHEAVVKLLPEKGANVKSKNNVSQTPLSRAGCKGVMKLLLKKGAEKLLH